MLRSAEHRDFDTSAIFQSPPICIPKSLRWCAAFTLEGDGSTIGKRNGGADGPRLRYRGLLR